MMLCCYIEVSPLAEFSYSAEGEVNSDKNKQKRKTQTT